MTKTLTSTQKAHAAELGITQNLYLSILRRVERAYAKLSAEGKIGGAA